jgi:hypothetical protein
MEYWPLYETELTYLRSHSTFIREVIMLGCWSEAQLRLETHNNQVDTTHLVHELYTIG